MKAVLIQQTGGELQVKDVAIPKLEADQILVKSLYMALNPVDAFMIDSGILIEEWPLTLGADGIGVVVELGEEAAAAGFKKGDYVCGCTRLGFPNHGSAAELHLRQSSVTMHKPSNITVAESAGLGAGFQTACIGLDTGLKIQIPEKKSPKVGEWVLVFGGAGSVGRAAVQLLLCAGYDVVTTCSSRSKEGLEALGAITVDYKQPDEDQIKAIQKITQGNLSRIFDAASSMDPVVARNLLNQISGPSYFTTTMDWGELTGFDHTEIHQIELGPIGRPGAEPLNSNIAKYNKTIVQLFEAGLLVSSEYDIYGEGLESAIHAYQHHKAGKGGNKRVVVKIQDE